jgi:Bacteriophage Lambda NinG protein
MLTNRRYTWNIPRTAFRARPLVVGSRRWLKAGLDKETSRIVRARDRRCVTCGSTRRLECSHFYSRAYVATRFDLRNCNAQCHACNLRHNYDPLPYLNYMQEHYGQEVIDELNALRMSLRKVSDAELSERLMRYRRM